MWEIATRGVLMIKSPLLTPVASAAEYSTTAALVEFLDIMPTLADLVSESAPA